MKKKVVLAFSGGLDTSFCCIYFSQRVFCNNCLNIWHNEDPLTDEEWVCFLCDSDQILPGRSFEVHDNWLQRVTIIKSISIFFTCI